MRKLMVLLGMAAAVATVVVVATMAAISSGTVDPVRNAYGQSCTTPPSGLVGWWDADAVSGTTAFDLVGGNDGIMVNGVAIVPGKVGDAFSFDGVDDFVATAPSPFSTAQIGTTGTIDAWVNFASLPPASEGALLVDIEGFVEIAYGTITTPPITTTETLKLRLFDPAVQQQKIVDTGITPVLGRWHHAAVTWDGSVMKGYLDGLQVGSISAGPIDPDRQNRPVSIGASSFDPTILRFNGLVDEVEIYDRALSTAEIQAIFNAGSAGKCKVSDSDGDGVPDVDDLCPSEDSTGFDADNDGCIDDIQGLIVLIDTLFAEDVIDSTMVNSLHAKIDAALASLLDRDKVCTAINQLESLKNQIEAQTGNKVSADAAPELLEYITNVQTFLVIASGVNSCP